MDVAETSWKVLEKAAEGKDTKMDGERNTLKKAVRGSMSKRSKNKPATTTHQLHTQRFTFSPKQKKKYDKKPKKKSATQLQGQHTTTV